MTAEWTCPCGQQNDEDPRIFPDGGSASICRDCYTPKNAKSVTVQEAVKLECVDRLGRVRDRMLDADFRTFEEVRIEVDRELREIGLRLLGVGSASS